MTEPKPDNRTVAVYARVSTLKQSMGLDAQLRALSAYCQQRGITNYIVFKDEGISGAKDSRPALNEMMEAVAKGKFKMVCVYSFSRYARSTTHLLRALETFKKKNVAFVSLTENINTDSSLGMAMFTIISAISQLERDLIRERVINGLKAAKARGVKIGRKKTRDSKLIRDLYSKGFTYRQISQASGASNGSIAAELRLYKMELKEKEELEKTLREREYKSIQDELQKTRAKMQLLEQKIPEEKRAEMEEKYPPCASTNTQC